RIALLTGVKQQSSKATAKASQASRTVGIGSQILHHLGVEKMILLSPVKKYRALSGFHLEVVDFISDEE
ncbi:MAG: bifunctional 3,4-dihydroxy-2-butanone-4-phosphate synthase/GTP cyclohydrolase II, partial [Gammaproteobacteria bacterium]|nr:bifunctional 3,4-dihydroxy-2-butanone-4-phosphate synthase/GTP cyclohydrolase II [Gammaproteobacteria bacterium]